MSTYPESPLGAILEPSSAFEPVEPDAIYVTAGIYSYGRGLFERPAISGSETNYSKYNKLKVGQFVYSKLFGWEGALATVSEEFGGLYVSHEFPTFEIRADRVDPRYVSHLATWEGLHAKLRDQGTGMGSRRQRVNVDRLLAVTIPLPDLPEQRRIAACLDSVLSKKIRIQEMQTRCAGLRDSLRASLLGNTGPYRPLGEVLTEANDMVAVDLASAYPIAGVYGYGRGMFGRGSVLGAETSYSKFNRLHKDRLVMSRLKAFEGALAIIPSEFDGWFLSHEFPTFEVDETDTSVRYIAQLCSWPAFWSLLSAESKGLGARKERVSADRLLAVKVPLPALPDQQRISSILDRVGVSRQLASDQESTIKALRKQLLHTAFSGQL